MLVDLRSLDGDADLKADICIIGAGAAGIALARELDGTSLDVCVLESGGLELEHATQDLYRGENVGIPNFDLDSSRARFFGGSTNHWLGWCAPLNEIDFEARDWIPHSGWPLDYGELASFYDRACAVLGLDSFRSLPISSRRARKALSFDHTKLAPREWQFSDPPLRFGQAFRRELAGSSNVQVILHANATDLAANHSARAIDHVAVRSLDGHRARVRARRYVLACGGIENARLLLASRGVAKRGLGNQHDLVGRYFMDHFELTVGHVTTDDAQRLLDAYGFSREEGRLRLTGLRLAALRQRSMRATNTAVYLAAAPAEDTGIAALSRLIAAVPRGEMPEDLSSEVGRILGDLDGTARHAWRRWVRGERRSAPIDKLRLSCLGEQVPNPASRVTLSDERDPLGIPRAQLDWRLSELDREGVAKLARTVGTELGRLGAGRLRLRDWTLETGGWPEDLQGGHHHMGTTRMADDPKAGVVDRNCRVHGIDNLYVAGSSVFPTAGYANPTLTILALTLRLADHLRDRARAERSPQLG